MNHLRKIKQACKGLAMLLALAGHSPGAQPDSEQAVNSGGGWATSADGLDSFNYVGEIFQEDYLSEAAVNKAPAFTSFEGNATARVQVKEESRARFALLAIDPDGDSLLYTISGGEDRSKFSIHPLTGALSWIGFPDFEKPRDTNKDNRYEVAVSANDLRGGVATQILVLEVINDASDDPPPLGSVRLTVVSPLGRAVPGAELVGRSGDSLRWLEAKTDENGTFLFSGLALGAWEFTAFPVAADVNTTSFRESRSVGVTVVPNATVNAFLILRSANVTGTVVVSENGKESPVEGAKVWAFLDEDEDGVPDRTGDSMSEAVMNTDAGGGFSFLLGLGKYSLRVIPPPGLPDQREPDRFQVVAGQAEPTVVRVVLSAPMHLVRGSVRDDSGNPVGDARVIFLGEADGGWKSVPTGADGNFSLNLPPGRWEARVMPEFGKTVDWSGEDAVSYLTLPDEGIPQGAVLNLVVRRKTSTGTLVGAIARPDGSMDWKGFEGQVSVEILAPGGEAQWRDVDANGTFSFSLEPGTYEARVLVATSLGYGAPEVRVAQVRKGGVYDLGLIKLLNLSSFVTGTLKNEDGEPLPGFYVYAVDEEGRMVSALTNAAGSYRLPVRPGLWKVSYEPPKPLNGGPSPYLSAEPKELSVKSGETALVSFVVPRATRLVSGTLKTPEGKLITGLKTWVYARRVDGVENAYAYVSEAYVDGLGRFHLHLPKQGEYRVGAWLPDGVEYVTTTESTVKAEDSTVEVVLRLSDVILKGDFTLQGRVIEPQGFIAHVVAIPRSPHLRGKVRKVTVGHASSYELKLERGSWLLQYQVVDQAFPAPVRTQARVPQSLTVDAGGTYRRDWALDVLSGSIGVKVFDENNATVQEGVYPWAEQADGRGNLSPEFKASSNVFSASVPLKMPFRVGLSLSRERREQGYLVPVVSKLVLEPANPSKFLEIRLKKRKPEEFLAGSVLDENGLKQADAFVYAWTEEGDGVEGYTDANGSFHLKARAGAKWRLGAEVRKQYLDASALLHTPEDLLVDLTRSPSREGIVLHLQRDGVSIPSEGSFVKTFDPRSDLTVSLSNGMEIYLPANSFLNHGEGEGASGDASAQPSLVHLIVQGISHGLSRNGREAPLGAGYSITLTDEEGRDLGGQLTNRARISMPFKETDLAKHKARKEDLSLSYFSNDRDEWIAVPVVLEDGYAHAWVDHFSKWALTVTPPEARPSTVPNVLTESLSVVEGTSRWYRSGWLGAFNDAGSGWVYHEAHGWLYSVSDGSGNYWLYHEGLGWLWTGPSIYGTAKGEHFLHSHKLGTWLHFDKAAGVFHHYGRSVKINHKGQDVIRVQATASDATMGLVSGGGYHPAGSAVNLQATTKDGFKFVEWRSSTRGVLGSQSTLNFSAQSPENITGVFRKETAADVLDSIFD